MYTTHAKENVVKHVRNRNRIYSPQKYFLHGMMIDTQYCERTSFLHNNSVHVYLINTIETKHGNNKIVDRHVKKRNVYTYL